MKSAIVLSSDEVKRIVAEHFHVHEDNVIKSKYSFIIIDVKCGDIIYDTLKGGEHNG